MSPPPLDARPNSVEIFPYRYPEHIHPFSLMVVPVLVVMLPTKGGESVENSKILMCGT
jgi:hypothetical protein